MGRSIARRMAPMLEDLEGRHLQSALVATTQAAPPATPPPAVEQGNAWKVDPGRLPGGVGGENQIIAILIG